MTDDFSAAEQRLIQSYQAQLPLYDQALGLAGSAEGTLAVEELNAVLQKIAALDAPLAAEKALWRASGRKPGQALREALDGVTERIRALAALVDQRVADLQARKQSLLPEVDECIQQRKMLHAYGKGR